MPYIPQHQRPEIDDAVAQLPKNMSAGQKNYAITRMIETDLRDGTSYDVINEWLGVLRGVELEFYRRIAAPYEDGKINTNGDAYYAKS